MRISRSLIKFARFCSITAIVVSFFGCKGRTMENMEPKGDTVEVVIEQPVTEENNYNNNE